MTTLLEQAIASVRGLSDEAQDALARMLLDLVDGDRSPLDLSASDAASFDESIGQADRGDFASDEQIRDIWAKHGL